MNESTYSIVNTGFRVKPGMTDKGKGFKTHYTRGQRLEAEGKNIFPSNLKWAKRALLKSTFMSCPRKRASRGFEIFWIPAYAGMTHKDRYRLFLWSKARDFQQDAEHGGIE